MFPENIVQAMFQQVETEYIDKNVTHPGNIGSFSIVTRSVHKHVNGMDALGGLESSMDGQGCFNTSGSFFWLIAQRVFNQHWKAI